MPVIEISDNLNSQRSPAVLRRHNKSNKKKKKKKKERKQSNKQTKALVVIDKQLKEKQAFLLISLMLTYLINSPPKVCSLVQDQEEPISSSILF